MRNIWFTSDSHFSHVNFLLFKDEDGEHIRKEFDNIIEMDETMISRWNARVEKDDIIYHLGDVCFGGAARLNEIASRLNGRKRLVMGNHDRHDIGVYTKHFQIKPAGRHFGSDVTGCDITFLVSHIPLHPELVRNSHTTGPVFNLHGHLHQRKLDGPYLNVCVENTDYAPISMEEVIGQLRQRHETPRLSNRLRILDW